MQIKRSNICLLSGAWSARWIASPDTSCRSPLFRKRFNLTSVPSRACAFICGLGYFELYLNGRRVGDHVLDPAQTDYETRALYVGHNVTDFLTAGENVVAVMLGNGFFNQDRVWGGMSYGLPRMIFQLHVEESDKPTIVSDASWLTTAGPVIENNVYAGETYDARREIEKWSEVGCDESKWTAAKEVESPTKALEPQTMPPIRRTKTLEPVKITKLPSGATIFDFGQNFAGWARLRVSGARAGAPIRLRTAESINADGTLDTASTGVFATRVEQIDTYVPKGGGEETWEPRFTYHGFRYVEVSGLAGAATKETLQGIVVHTDLEPIGTFACSDPVLNRIYETAKWTLLSNVHGIPTDCPAREKCGWLGDAQITSEFALLNFDAGSFYAKYLHDIETSWHGDAPGDVAPGKRCSAPNGHLDWGLAIVFVPWHVYLYGGGDEAILRDHYDSMRRFMLAARKQAKDGILSHGYGDWCPPGSVEPPLTPPALTTTAWFVHAARIMQRVATIVKRDEDVATFAAMAKEYLAAFNHTFFKRDKQTYGSQCADAMALELDLCLADQVTAVAASLNRDVVEVHKTHHTTGIFGSPFLYSALARHGYGSTSLALLRQTTYPSIGYLFSLGATTFWECWGEKELDDKWGARSKNHPMQAAFVAWIHQGLAGINYSPDRKLILRPQFIDDPTLTEVKATHRGITSAWKNVGNHFNWHIELPPATTATAYTSAFERELSPGAHDIEVPKHAILRQPLGT